MAGELTPLSAWDPEVSQTIERYRGLIIEEFRAIEPVAEGYDLIEPEATGPQLEFSDAYALTYSNNEGWDIFQERRARVVHTNGYGYRATSFPKSVIARFAFIEKRTDGFAGRTKAEKRYLQADNPGTGTRPLSLVRLALAMEYKEEEGVSREKNVGIETSVSELFSISELELFFLEAVDLITI